MICRSKMSLEQPTDSDIVSDVLKLVLQNVTFDAKSFCLLLCSSKKLHNTLLPAAAGRLNVAVSCASFYNTITNTLFESKIDSFRSWLQQHLTLNTIHSVDVSLGPGMPLDYIDQNPVYASLVKVLATPQTEQSPGIHGQAVFGTPAAAAVPQDQPHGELLQFLPVAAARGAHGRAVPGLPGGTSSNILEAAAAATAAITANSLAAPQPQLLEIVTLNYGTGRLRCAFPPHLPSLENLSAVTHLSTSNHPPALALSDVMRQVAESEVRRLMDGDSSESAADAPDPARAFLPPNLRSLRLGKLEPRVSLQHLTCLTALYLGDVGWPAPWDAPPDYSEFVTDSGWLLSMYQQLPTSLLLLEVDTVAEYRRPHRALVVDHLTRLQHLHIGEGCVIDPFQLAGQGLGLGNARFPTSLCHLDLLVDPVSSVSHLQPCTHLTILTLRSSAQVRRQATAPGPNSSSAASDQEPQACVRLGPSSLRCLSCDWFPTVGCFLHLSKLSNLTFDWSSNSPDWKASQFSYLTVLTALTGLSKLCCIMPTGLQATTTDVCAFAAACSGFPKVELGGKVSLSVAPGQELSAAESAAVEFVHTAGVEVCMLEGPPDFMVFE